jgi:DNA-binding beta-propeller fold protein YncE
VADSGNNRVLRFDDPPSLPNGGAAAGVLGQTNFTANDSDDLATTMDYPMGLAVQNGNLWVSDNSNNRVLKFTAAYFQANGAPANLVLGQPNFDSSAVGQGAAGMYAPRGVALDAGGRLWVCDSANDRIVYFNNAAAKANGAAASGLLGQPSLDLDPAKEMWPQGVAIDPLSGKVFVADAARHRVLRFADSAVLASGAAAEAVFGQPNFSSGEPATSASRMRFPSGLCIDAQGRLWVADSNNHRVLRFDNASSRASGVSADRVLGQANFTTMETALNASTFDSPQAVSVDSGGRLWVADRSHNRILRFDNAASKVNGAAADGVLGQPDFTSDGIPGTRTASSLAHPYQALADTAGHLWVADYGSNRVLRFDAAASLANGAAASGVLGQTNFSTYEEGPQDYALRGPKCLALDGSGGLWIGDTFNYRLVRHSAAASVANGASASFQLGQQDWGFQISGAALNRFSPEAICIAPGGCLWVVDGGPSRVLRFTPSVAITATGQDGLGKFFLTATTSEGYLYDVSSSTDLIEWSPAGSFSAAAGGFTTWTSPAAVSGKRFYRLSER